MPERLTIEELEPGGSVELLAMLRDINLRTTKAGKPYLALNLSDRTGSVQARAWDEAPQLNALLSSGDAALVQGIVETFGDKLQLKVRSMTAQPWDEATRRMLLPVSSRDFDEMWGELLTGIAEIRNPELRTFIETFVESDEIRAGLRTAPAARIVHHAWVGGLLEHTVSMLTAAMFLADHYAPQVPALNRDLLLAGAVLHDVGKITEISGGGGGMDYSTRGRLLGHMGLAIQMLERHRTAGHPLAEDTMDRLVHLVLSHHGDKEKGSPVEPATAEALLLHEIDMMDSRMAMAARLAKDPGSDGWTQFDRFLGGAIYVEKGISAERVPTPADSVVASPRPDKPTLL